MTRHSLRFLFALTAILVLRAAAPLGACTVPVFRYGLERWPPDAHMVSLATNVTLDKAAIETEHHANLWIKRGDPKQTNDVVVFYAAGAEEWYRGDWRPGLLTELADSPLRRRIAHELVTGTAAALVLLESDNPATNTALHAMLRKRITALTMEIKLPKTLDYADEADGWTGGGSGRDLSKVPTQVSFSLHRLSRNAKDETFFIRQLTGLDPSLASPAEPAVAVIFGQGRMIPLFDDGLAPGIIDNVCAFLCSACSCRVKALNPGLDLLMTANWDEAVRAYPAAAATRLPNGEEFTLGGIGPAPTPEPEPTPAPPVVTVPVEPALSAEVQAPPPEKGAPAAPGTASRRPLPVLVGLAAAVVAALVWILRRPR